MFSRFIRVVGRVSTDFLLIIFCTMIFLRFVHTLLAVYIFFSFHSTFVTWLCLCTLPAQPTVSTLSSRNGHATKWLQQAPLEALTVHLSMGCSSEDFLTLRSPSCFRSRPLILVTGLGKVGTSGLLRRALCMFFYQSSTSFICLSLNLFKAATTNSH